MFRKQIENGTIKNVSFGSTQCKILEIKMMKSASFSFSNYIERDWDFPCVAAHLSYDPGVELASIAVYDQNIKPAHSKGSLKTSYKLNKNPEVLMEDCMSSPV